MHVLGIDAGGTKTVCQLADEHGRRARRRRVAAARTCRPSGELAGREGPPRRHGGGDRRRRCDMPVAICLGIAGVDRRRRFPRSCEAIMRASATRRACSSSTTRWSRSRPARPDSPGSWSSPAPDRSPTGATPAARRRASGGWGYVLGDEGSGYWIGRAALRAVLRESDRRGAPTRCSRLLLLEHFGVSDPQDLIHEVYHANLRPAAIGALAQCVQQAFTEGDPVAIGHPARAARRARRLRRCRWRAGSSWSGKRLRFILAGGIFRAVPGWSRSSRGACRSRAPHEPRARCSIASRPRRRALALAKRRRGAEVPAFPA